MFNRDEKKAQDFLQDIFLKIVEKPHIICETVEELLIQQSVAPLNDKDAALVREHVETCPDCRRFASWLANVQVIHDLKIVDDQKIGTTVSEDTLLTKYVFSVM